MTSRIALVADNRSLSLGLTGQDYDVVDLRPDQLSAWLAGSDPLDLLVVGVEQPADALDIVGEFRRSHGAAPVLVVASHAPGWTSLGQAGDLAVEILALPVTRLSLVAAVRRLLEPSVTQTTVTPATEMRRSSPGASAANDEPAIDAGIHERIVAVRSTDGLRERLAQRPVTASSDLTPHISDWRPVRGPEPTVGGPPPAALIAELLTRLDELVDVRDAANALVEETAALADAAAAALLLPDDGVWRVCGAYGARPLEWRYVVEPDSWLTATVVEGGRGVIVEESDIARQRLGGAPLAHHRHLMAAPVPAARGLLILANDTDVFDESKLSAVARACADSARLLVESIQLRTLARALTDFRDLDA